MGGLGHRQVVTNRHSLQTMAARSTLCHPVIRPVIRIASASFPPAVLLTLAGSNSCRTAREGQMETGWPVNLTVE